MWHLEFWGVLYIDRWARSGCVRVYAGNANGSVIVSYFR